MNVRHMVFFEYLRSDFFVVSTACVFIVATLFLKFSYPNKIAYWFLTLSLLLFLYFNIVAFRPLDAGNDTRGYVRVFDAIDNADSAHELGAKLYGSKEFIFWRSVSCLKYFTSNSRVFIFFTSALSLLLVLLCSRKACVDYCRGELYLYPAFCLCTYYAYCLVYFGNHLRASIAIPICVLAMLLRLNGRSIFWPGVCFFVGFGMHLSTIFFVPFLFVKKAHSLHNSVRFRLLVFILLALAWVLGFYFFKFFNHELLSTEHFGLKNKLHLYINHEFNGFSIYGSVTFWFVTASVLSILVFGLSRIHLITFYNYGLVLFTAQVPKVSERFLPFILTILPIALYVALRLRLGVKASVIIITILYALFGILVALTDSAAHTLGLNRLM